MAKELISADTKIEQKPALNGDRPADRESDVVVAAKVINKDYADELAFNEEPVTVRLERGSDKNAPRTQEIWCNGKGCEIWDEKSKRWMEITHVPIARVVTIKRKYLAILAGTKRDQITVSGTDPEDVGKVHANRVERDTSSACMFSVIADRNPRGAEWLTELLRRNY